MSKSVQRLVTSRARIELEGRPIEWFAEDTVGVEQGELGGAQGGGRVLAFTQFAVELVHELRRGGVVHFPEGGNDVVRAGAQECPGESDEAFSGVGAGAGAITSRNGNKVGGERVVDDVAGVEFERIAGGTTNDRGAQRLGAGRPAVGGEIQIGKALRRVRHELAGSSLRPCQNRAPRLRKVPLD